MSTINKVTVVVNVEGSDKPQIAALAFQGFEPDTHDVVRLFEVVKEKAGKVDAEPQLKLNVTGDPKNEIKDKA